MSLDFGDVHTNYLYRDEPLISTDDPTPFSLAVWVNLQGAAGADGNKNAIFSNSHTGSGPNIYLATDSNNTSVVKQQFASSSYGANSNTWTPTSTFDHLGWTYSSAYEVEYYRNGAGNGSTTNTLSGQLAGNSASIGSLGRGFHSLFDFKGLMAHFAIWNAVLTEAEYLRLYLGANPLSVRFNSLISYLPMTAGNPGIDLVGQRPWLAEGTVTSNVTNPLVQTRPTLNGEDFRRTLRFIEHPEAAAGNQPIFLYHNRHHNRGA